MIKTNGINNCVLIIIFAWISTSAKETGYFWSPQSSLAETGACGDRTLVEHAYYQLLTSI
jgi:hypothetical protein